MLAFILIVNGQGPAHDDEVWNCTPDSLLTYAELVVFMSPRVISIVDGPMGHDDNLEDLVGDALRDFLNE